MGKIAILQPIKLTCCIFLLFACSDAPSIEVELPDSSRQDIYNQEITFSAVPPFDVKKLPTYKSSFVLYGAAKLYAGTIPVHFSIELDYYTFKIVVDENLNQTMLDDREQTLNERAFIEGSFTNGMDYELYVSIKKGKVHAEMKFKNVHHGERRSKLQTTSFTLIDTGLDGRFNSSGDLLLIDRPFAETMEIRLDEEKESRLFLWGGDYSFRISNDGRKIQFRLIPKEE
jgi:hypothetical protein